MTSETAQFRTPLYNCHVEAGARFVPFGGWEMPVQYSGLVDEHTTVRERAGIFDVSHMGEVIVRGPAAYEFLQHVTSNDVSRLQDGRAQYSLLTNENGGVVDDIIIYRRAEDDYLLCVNAANTAKDVDWLTTKNTFGADVQDVSSSYAQIAVQGPLALDIVCEALELPVSQYVIETFPPFSFKTIEHDFGSGGEELIIARTGYTGEDGVEIFSSPTAAPQLWNALMEAGSPMGLKPAGLGARDTLRLEACYPLHGHELADDITALESGLGWVVKLGKESFIGREKLQAEKERGSERKLVGFFVSDSGIARHGAELFSAEGERVGFVTSGTKPPTIGKALGLALVSSAFAKTGTELFAEVRSRKLKIEVVKKPFYKRA